MVSVGREATQSLRQYATRIDSSFCHHRRHRRGQYHYLRLYSCLLRAPALQALYSARTSPWYCGRRGARGLKALAHATRAAHFTSLQSPVPAPFSCTRPHRQSVRRLGNNARSRNQAPANVAAATIGSVGMLLVADKILF